MRSWVQFLTTPTADTPGTTLLLHFDNKRYLIGNLAEGTQRASIQRGAKLIKVSDILLTGRVEWSNIGGLLGMVLTLADATSAAATTLAGIAESKAGRRQKTGDTPGGREDPPLVLKGRDTRPKLRVHGGENLSHMLASARRFVFRTGMPVHVHEHSAGTDGPHNGSVPPSSSLGSNRADPSSPSRGHGDPSDDGHSPTWNDENIKVWALPIRPSRPDGGSPAADEAVRSRKRSFDEFKGPAVRAQDASLAAVDRDRQIRKAVVSEMFDSAWRLDALLEMPLDQVQLPAALFIRNPESGRIEKYTGPLPPAGGNAAADAASWMKTKVLVRKPWPGALIESLPPTRPSSVSMSYIIKNHPQRGKFVPEKAIRLGVEKGPKFAELTRGKNVTVANGTVVTPNMVLTPGKEGGGVVVVDLPSVDYVDDLISREEWKLPSIMNGVEAVIWLLGPGVGLDGRLRAFFQACSSMKHIVSSADYCPNYLALDSAAAAAIRLHQIDPIHFPVPVHDNTTLPQPITPPALASPSVPAGGDGLFVPAQRGLLVQLEPTVEVQDRTVQPHLNTAKVWKDTPADVLHLARKAKEALAAGELRQRLDHEQRTLPGQDAEIVTLGTGSALPSKYRNVSATLLRVPGLGSYLFDCGENTLGQLRRVFNPTELAEVLGDLKAIWISHLHADHHLGTVSVIKAWHQHVWGGPSPTTPSGDAEGDLDVTQVLENDRRLFILSDDGMIHWLEEYSSMEDFGYDKLVPLSVQSARRNNGFSTRMTWKGVHVGFDTANGALNRATAAAMGVSNIQAVDVSHCHGAMAVSLTFPTGFKFSYSGDCRPSNAFAQIGKGSTVLVHEATFDDELQGDAVAKKHSTTSEALGVGIAMGARRVLLTHFSQRYQKIPIMDAVDGAEPSFEDVPEDEQADGVDLGIATLIPNRNDIAADRVADVGPSREPRQGSEERVVKVKNSTKAAADMKIGVAFDYMRVKVGEISHLEQFTPALLKLFDVADVEEKEAEKKSSDRPNSPADKAKPGKKTKK
ncbi:MAG: hypothetical protein M1838_001217 [Thelocarpon superellum]|nr:MAG: hypothetical protein M1838_001217 [Thelocarpon superellum]